MATIPYYSQEVANLNLSFHLNIRSYSRKKRAQTCLCSLLPLISDREKFIVMDYINNKCQYCYFLNRIYQKPLLAIDVQIRPWRKKLYSNSFLFKLTMCLVQGYRYTKLLIRLKIIVQHVLVNTCLLKPLFSCLSWGSCLAKWSIKLTV